MIQCERLHGILSASCKFLLTPRNLILLICSWSWSYHSITMNLPVIKFLTLNIIIMVIVVIINIIKSHNITMKLSGIKLLSITIIVIIINIVKFCSITITVFLISLWFNLLICQWQHFLIICCMFFLDLHRTFSCSQHLWQNHVCFCCYEINSV